MKAVFLFLCLLTGVAHALGFRVDSSSNNIPTSASTAEGSKVLSGIGANRLRICSTATTAIRYNFSLRSTPPATTDFDLILPAAATSSFICADHKLKVSGTNLYLWSDGSAISSGIVHGGTWNE